MTANFKKNMNIFATFITLLNNKKVIKMSKEMKAVHDLLWEQI